MTTSIIDERTLVSMVYPSPFQRYPDMPLLEALSKPVFESASKVKTIVY